MPDPMSGLGLSDSRNVPEGEHAIYKCMKDDHHVPGTPDGVFRVPCKRSGAFEQSMRTKWTACQVKPAADDGASAQSAQAPPSTAPDTFIASEIHTPRAGDRR